MDIAQAIEIAEHNGQWDDGRLVVFDGSVNDRYYGVVLTVEHMPSMNQRHKNGVYAGVAKDGCGKRFTCYHPRREAAVQRALEGFIKLLKGRS